MVSSPRIVDITHMRREMRSQALLRDVSAISARQVSVVAPHPSSMYCDMDEDAGHLPAEELSPQPTDEAPKNCWGRLTDRNSLHSMVDSADAIMFSVVQHSPHRVHSFSLMSGAFLRIGAGKSNDIVLDCGGVSEYHAELFLQHRIVPGRHFSWNICIRDDSGNGTGLRPGPTLSNHRVRWNKLSREPSSKCVLEHGWQIRIPLRGPRGGRPTFTLYIKG